MNISSMKPKIIIIALICILSLSITACSSSNAQNTTSQSSNKNSYEITLDANGGEVEEESLFVEKGQEVDSLPEPNRGNYAFMGWYTTTRGGIVADLEEYNLKTDESFTLYARWAPIELYQFDEKWAKQKYNNGENNDTVRGSGCGPGVMAIADITINDSDTDIGKACKWSMEHDFFTTANGRTKDGFFEAYGKAHNLNVKQLYTGDLRAVSEEEANVQHQKAFESVKQGNWIVAFMGEGKWTTGGHFVLWYDVSDEEDVFIRDTNSKKDFKAKNKFDVFKETVIRYWEIQVPDDKKLSID